MNRMMCLCSLLFCAACNYPNPAAPTPATIKPTTSTVTVPPVVTPVPVVTPGGWSETFSGALSSRWTISNYTGIGGTVFTPNNVDLSQGVLSLALSGFSGAEVQSVNRYGFGTYTWVERASSTSPTPMGSGSAGNGETSACFLFYNNSTTEIDFEQEGANPTFMSQVMFDNGNIISLNNTVVPTIWQTFHTYSLVWSSSSVIWLIDGQQASVQTQSVPQDPAYVLMNHWAASGAWGGTINDFPQYMYVQSFSYVPLVSSASVNSHRLVSTPSVGVAPSADRRR